MPITPISEDSEGYTDLVNILSELDFAPNFASNFTPNLASDLKSSTGYVFPKAQVFFTPGYMTDRELDILRDEQARERAVEETYKLNPNFGRF